MATQDKSVSIAPYFKVHSGKMMDVKALCERFVEKTKTEPGCLYYGFTFNGDTVFCREAYLDGDAALALLRAEVQPGDVVLVKAAHAAGLGALADALASDDEARP